MSSLINNNVVIVVATFQPNHELIHLCKSLSNTKVSVIVSDDASPVTSDRILREISELDFVQVVRHPRNQGIARSLNVGLDHATKTGASWLLTIDQDSELTDNYVSTITEFADSWNSLWNEQVQIGAVGAGEVLDSSGPLRYPITKINTTHGEISCTEEVIQSGTLWSVAAMNAVGGFDESLGIDAVDAAACLRLREQGYRIALAPDLVLRHRLGETRAVSIFGKTVLATGHSGERRATMMRNRLRLAPAEFRQSPKHAIRTLRRVGVNAVLGITVENNRWDKAKGSIRGLRRKSKG